MLLRALALVLVVLAFAAPAHASSTFSNLPAAQQPVGSIFDAVPLDQGSGCSTNSQPCTTVQTPSLRLGQPLVQNCSTIPAPFQHQQCFDTSANPAILKVYVGTSWLPIADFGGGVVGPATTIVNDCAAWANATGTALGDAGSPCIRGPATTIIGDCALWSNTLGSGLADMPCRGISTSVLATLPAVTGASVVITAPGAPPATYLAQNGSCVISDGGSCFPALNSGSWLLAPQTVYDIRWWGLTSSPVALTVSKTGNDDGGANFCVDVSLPCATIAHALVIADKFDAAGGNIQINVGPGVWNEDVLLSNKLRGSVNNNTDPNACGGSPTTCAVANNGQLLISGAGSTSTTIAGSGSFCGTVIASNHTVIGFRAMTLTATATACQNSLFAQMGSIINVYDDVNFGPASVSPLHSENGANITFWGNSIVSGGAIYLAAAGSNGDIICATCTITFVGTPSFRSIWFGDGNAVFQHNPASVYSGAVTLSGFTYVLKGGSLLEFYGTPNPLPGPGNGVLYNGARYVNFNNDTAAMPCVGGNVGCALTLPVPTGLGAGGTVSVIEGATPYAGKIDLHTGTGATGSGSFFLSFPSSLITGESITGLCTFITAIDGTLSGTPGVWTPFAFVRGATNGLGPPSAVPILWANGLSGSPLVPQVLGDNLDYFINYTCNN